MTLQADEVVINSTIVAWHGPKMLQVFTSLPLAGSALPDRDRAKGEERSHRCQQVGPFGAGGSALVCRCQRESLSSLAKLG